MRLPSCSTVLACAVLTTPLAAQFGRGGFGGGGFGSTPSTPSAPSRPMIAPPVEHPALAAQPLMQPPTPTSPPTVVPTPSASGAGAKQCEPPPEVLAARAFQEVRVTGDALKAAVQRVALGVTWYSDLDKARAAATASGKPLLWIQALGDLSGFA